MHVLRNTRVLVFLRDASELSAPEWRWHLSDVRSGDSDDTLRDLIFRIGPHDDGNPAIWGRVETDRTEIRWGNVPASCDAGVDAVSSGSDLSPWGWTPDEREAVVFTTTSADLAHRRAEACAEDWFPGMDPASFSMEGLQRVGLWLCEQGGVWTVERYTLALEGHLVDWTGPPHSPLGGVRVIGPSIPGDGPKRPGVALPIPPAPRPPLDVTGLRVRPGRMVRGRWSAKRVPGA